MPDVSTSMVLAACLVAAVTDLWCYRIHNLLTIPLLFLGLAYWLGLAGGWGLAASLSGAGVGFVALFGLYLAGGMGAGDVKLMAGLGAWLGPAMISHVLLASCAVGGVYGLGLLVWNRLRPPTEDEACRKCSGSIFGRRLQGEELARLTRSPTRRRQLIPYGPVIFIGLLATLFTCT